MGGGARNSHVGSNPCHVRLVILDWNHSLGVGNSGDGRAGLARLQAATGKGHSIVRTSKEKRAARYVRITSGVCKMARGNSVGDWGPHVALGVSLHTTGSLHRS